MNSVTHVTDNSLREAMLEEPVAFFDFDVLGIKKEGEEIGIEGTRVAELKLFQEVAGHGFQVLFGSGQTDSAQGSLGRLEGTTRGEQAEQQGLGFFRVIALVGRRQDGGSKVAAAGARNVNLERHRTQV